jgi:hypothetical protein
VCRVAIDLEEVMRTLLNKVYYKLRKEEIEKASTRFKRIKIDTILEMLTKICWKYNIQYKVIIKASDMLTIKLIGNRETVVFKYHKTDMVLKDDVDFFMNELDENKAHKGVYLTTGRFEQLKGLRCRDLVTKKDCMLEDGFVFIKRHIGLRGKAVRKFKIDKLNFFKYLPQ